MQIMALFCIDVVEKGKKRISRTKAGNRKPLFFSREIHNHLRKAILPCKSACQDRLQFFRETLKSGRKFFPVILISPDKAPDAVAGKRIQPSDQF